MTCRNCIAGNNPVVIVSPTIHGEIYTTIYKPCPCCHGEWQNCQTCWEEDVEHMRFRIQANWYLHTVGLWRYFSNEV